MFDKTITIFNRYHSPLGDIWYPHVVKGVQVTADKASIVATYGAQSTDSAKLLINYSKREDGPYIGDLPYLPPKEWSALVNEKLPEVITLNDNAQYFDFFILGEYPEEPISDDDYRNGFYNHINTEKDYVYAITSVGDYSGLLPHFEILAR